MLLFCNTKSLKPLYAKKFEAFFSDVPGEIRTPDRWLRRPMTLMDSMWHHLTESPWYQGSLPFFVFWRNEKYVIGSDSAPRSLPIFQLIRKFKKWTFFPLLPKAKSRFYIISVNIKGVLYIKTKTENIWSYRHGCTAAGSLNTLRCFSIPSNYKAARWCHFLYSRIDLRKSVWSFHLGHLPWTRWLSQIVEPCFTSSLYLAAAGFLVSPSDRWPRNHRGRTR